MEKKKMLVLGEKTQVGLAKFGDLFNTVYERKLGFKADIQEAACSTT